MPERNKISRSDFLKLSTLLGFAAGGLALGYHAERARRLDAILHSCDIDNLSKEMPEIVLEGENNVVFGEPAVAISKGKLVAAANSKKVNFTDEQGRKVIEYYLPIQTWIHDINTGQTIFERIKAGEEEIWGSDSSLTVMPDGNVALSTLGIIPVSELNTTRKLIVSHGDLYNGTWQHQIVDEFKSKGEMVKMSGDIDKPWIASDSNGIWVTFDSDIYSNDIHQSIKLLNSKNGKDFSEACSFYDPEDNFSGFPIILPAKDGKIHIIYENMNFNTNSGVLYERKISERVYDPQEGELSDRRIIIEDNTNQIFVLGHWNAIANHNGIITPKGGLIFTTSKTDSGIIVVGYQPPDGDEWQIYETQVLYPETQVGKSDFSGFATPVVIGRDTVAVTSNIGSQQPDLSGTMHTQTLYFRERNGILEPIQINEPFYDGPFPCTASSNLDIGDYYQVVSDPRSPKGVPMVSLNNNEQIRIKLYDPVF